MSEIKLTINAPITNITVASSINTQQYIQSKRIENTDSSDLFEKHDEGEDKENPLIFDEAILHSFHREFDIDNFLWESVGIEIFKNWFRVTPIGKPKIKDDMISYFGYAVWKISDYRQKEICPNFQQWYSAFVGSKTILSKLKGQLAEPQKSEVDTRIEAITRFIIG